LVLKNNNQLTNLNALINDEISAAILSRKIGLYNLMSYHFGWTGKPGEDFISAPKHDLHNLRRYGLACLVAAISLDNETGECPAAVSAGSAIEMLATFAEIHDDIQAGRPVRNDRDAVWWVWGPAQAINAGDGLHALARLVILNLTDKNIDSSLVFEATKVIDNAALAMCEGRFIELEAQERIDITVEQYLDMAQAKSGSIMAGAMKLGAMLSKTGSLADEFAEFGTNIGIATQIADDIKELYGEPSNTSAINDRPSEEVLNKKKLLPIISAISNADITNKRKLGEIYFKRVLTPDDVKDVRQLVSDLGGKDFAKQTLNDYIDTAFKSVSKIDFNQELLKSFTKILTNVD
tara:strand:+ start:2970 stop:4019 length:1050 start_codon:yes stop_codon:yes gene_type:complete